MIIDERNEFADSVAIPTSAGAVAQLGDSIDLGGAVNVGSGEYTDFCVTVEEDITGATAVQFDLVSDAQDPVTPASATVHGSTGAVPVADLVAGKVLSFQLPKGFNYERYLGVVVRVTGTATAGKVNAFLADQVGQWQPTVANTGL